MINYNGFEEDMTHEHSALLLYIKKTLENLSKEKKIPNLNIFSNDHITERSKISQNLVNLCISGENMHITYKNYKIELLSHHINNLFLIDITKFLYTTLFFILPSRKKIFLNYQRERFFNYSKSTLTKNNNFAILTNNLKSKNILNFPYFFHTHFDRFQEFINIKKEHKYRKKKKFCAFVVSNFMHFDRITFYKKLSKYKKVDSFGPIFNNASIPEELIKKYKSNSTNHQEKRCTYNFNLVNQELFRDYKFVICFENSYADDYITEKLPNVMMANSIGIYRGAKNISEFFNTKSFINYDDYGNYNKMIEKIIELDKDDNKYQAMLNEPFFPNNQLPIRVKNAKQDLENFLEKVINL